MRKKDDISGKEVASIISSPLVIPQRFDEILNHIKKDVSMSRNELVAWFAKNADDAIVEKIRQDHLQYKLDKSLAKIEEIKEMGGSRQCLYNHRQVVKQCEKLLAR